MKNDITDVRLQMAEIRSCMIILQKAIENESEEICFDDISNYLEIAIDKATDIIDKFDYIINSDLNHKEN